MKHDRMTAARIKSMTIRSDREYGMLASSFIHWERGNIYNTVISGGTLADRTAVEISLIRMARRTGDRDVRPVPVIILEQGNRVLEQTYCHEGGNARIRGSNVCVEPLAGLSDAEIAGRLYRVARILDSNCQGGLRNLLRIGCELLRKQNIEPGIFSLSRIPWNRLPGYIDKMVENDQLEQEEAMVINGELGQLSGDAGQADDLLSQLSKEYRTMAAEDVPAVNLEQLIAGDGLACFCLMSGMRTFRELLALSLQELTLQGRQFLLVADSVQIPSGESFLRELLCSRSTEYSTVLAYEDMPARLSDGFAGLIAGDTNIILFAHQSGKSTEAWADFIGKSYQIKESSTYGESHGQAQLLDRQISKSSSREEELRYRIASEQIQNLPHGQAIVQSGEPGADLWFVDYVHMFNLQKNKLLQIRGR